MGNKNCTVYMKVKTEYSQIFSMMLIESQANDSAFFSEPFTKITGVLQGQVKV